AWQGATATYLAQADRPRLRSFRLLDYTCPCRHRKVPGQSHRARFKEGSGGRQQAEHRNIVDEVKMHAFRIKRLLHRLVDLVGDDDDIRKGVEKFLVEEPPSTWAGSLRARPRTCPAWRTNLPARSGSKCRTWKAVFQVRLPRWPKPKTPVVRKR